MTVSNAEGPLDKTPESVPPPSTANVRRAHGRIAAVIIVVTLILLVATALVSVTWTTFWNNSPLSLWQLLPFGLTITFIATTILARRHSSVWLRIAYRISAIWFGLLNFTFFASCALWIFAVVGVRSPTTTAICFGSSILAAIYGLANASWLRVTRITVKLDNLPESWRGRTIALMTDLHLGNYRVAGFARRVVSKVRELQPQAIFITGDLYDGSKADLDALIEPLNGLSAPAGTYFITGNHEEFTSRAKYLNAVSRIGIRILNNEKVESDGLQIVGIHDREAQDPQIFRSLLRRAKLDRTRPSILLCHRPAHLSIPEAEGIALQVSGHTHGGQIWPWTWVAARVHGQFNHGLRHLGKMRVYTGYGAGTWGAPMRLGTNSEITLIRLE